LHPQVSEFKEAFEMFSGGKPHIAKADVRLLFKQYGAALPSPFFSKKHTDKY